MKMIVDSIGNFDFNVLLAGFNDSSHVLTQVELISLIVLGVLGIGICLTGWKFVRVWELNGDIIVYYPVLDMGLELSSMGIRVDEVSLKNQLKEARCEERAELPFQKALLNGELPYTVGGGIGQSRICMYYLRKAHIGEVQSSLWPDDVAEKAAAGGIQLL